MIKYLCENKMKDIFVRKTKTNNEENQFQFPLKYRKDSYRKTFKWLNKNCQKLITSDLDYEIPMQKVRFTTTFIPNPINTDKIVF